MSVAENHAGYRWCAKPLQKRGKRCERGNRERCNSVRQHCRGWLLVVRCGSAQPTNATLSVSDDGTRGRGEKIGGPGLSRLQPAVLGCPASLQGVFVCYLENDHKKHALSTAEQGAGADSERAHIHVHSEPLDASTHVTL